MSADVAVDAGSALRKAAGAARVLVVGSLNVDLILHADREPADGGAVALRSIVRAVGGHAGNCASALAALGISTALLAAVGDDEDGALLVDDLAGRGVDVTATRRFAGAESGRVYIPVLGDKQYMLLARGANDLLRASDVREALAGPVDAVMLFDPSDEALLEVATAVRRHPRRPLLCWTPGGVNAREPVAATVVPHCDVVLLNTEEHHSIAHVVPQITHGRPGLEVVVTLGAAGARARIDSTEWRVPAPAVPVADPTGAGDAFAASYLLARLAGLDPESRLAAGNAAGALAVTAIGARARLARLDDIIAALAHRRPPPGPGAEASP